jgi:glycosyltransferase involved in cell wall biosynthesis
MQNLSTRKAFNPFMLDVPKIYPTEEKNRPFWSVMIPTYNGTQYLRETIACVIDQIPATEYVQIEVVDDCSSDDPETLVKEVGQGRVSFYRNPENQGLVGNWNACIQRAKGEWVHILHQDDLVLPGFYQHLRQGIEAEPNIGAAFCRHVFMDGEGHWMFMSSIENRSAGVIPDWLERIAVVQSIQFPSIVVKRSAYEQVGGFCADVHYAADWEMWKRIATAYGIRYEPKVMACYRVHGESETSKLKRTAQEISDIGKAIEMSRQYLPQDKVEVLSQKSKKRNAQDVILGSRGFALQGDLSVVTLRIRKALALDASLSVLKSALKIWFIGFTNFIKHTLTSPT